MKFRDIILDWLKKWLIGYLFKKILGGMVGGIKGFLLKLVINYAWKKVLKPALHWLSRKADTAMKRPIYKKKAKDLEGAKNEDDFDSAVDDLP
jgi:uncharacterized membrane protein required for colicin V production